MDIDIAFMQDQNLNVRTSGIKVVFSVIPTPHVKM